VEKPVDQILLKKGKKVEQAKSKRTWRLAQKNRLVRPVANLSKGQVDPSIEKKLS